MSEAIVCRLRRFSRSRMGRGREAAQVEIDGEILWMSRDDIQKNIDVLGQLPGLVDAENAYRRGVEVEKIIFDERHDYETPAENGSLTKFEDRPAGQSIEEWARLAESTIDSYHSQLSQTNELLQQWKTWWDEFLVALNSQPSFPEVRPPVVKPDPVVSDNGSSFIDAGSVTISCMNGEARDLLDDVMAAYRSHYNKEMHTADPDQVYQFAYWLCRWSGLVKRAATPRLEPEVRAGDLLIFTCPGCGRRDDTGISTEVMTGVVKCGHCGVTSTPFIEK